MHTASLSLLSPLFQAHRDHREEEVHRGRRVDEARLGHRVEEVRAAVVRLVHQV